MFSSFFIASNRKTRNPKICNENNSCDIKYHRDVLMGFLQGCGSGWRLPGSPDSASEENRIRIRPHRTNFIRSSGTTRSGSEPKKCIWGIIIITFGTILNLQPILNKKLDFGWNFGYGCSARKRIRIFEEEKNRSGYDLFYNTDPNPQPWPL